MIIKTLSIYLLLMGSLIPALSQKINYYYGSNTRPVDTMEEAVTYKQVHKKSDNRFVIKTYHRAKEKWILTLKEWIRSTEDGEQIIKYKANNFFSRKKTRTFKLLEPEGYYFMEKEKNLTIREGFTTRTLPLHLNGTVKEYHSNGELKSVSLFENNQLISNENYLRDGSKYIDSIFFSVDKEAEYKFGESFFNNYILQSLAQSKLDLSQIDDEVIIGMVIMETGRIEGVIALQGRSAQLNNYLVQLVSSIPGEWQPATLNNKKVRYFMRLPFNFRQSDVRFQDVELSGGMLHYNSY